MPQDLTAIQKLINTAIEFCVQYSFQVLGAILVLILGNVAAHYVSGFFLKMFQKKNMDITLSKFIANVVRIIVLAFAFLIALGNFGITIAPFIAALSAVAFGASLAIQGPLSNYGAGISIILSRPFVVGNTITVAGKSGVVDDVRLACTTLTNEEGEKITIPNKEIVGQIIENSFRNKLAAGVVGIKYDRVPEKAIQIVERVIKSFDEVARDPKPNVGIESFGDSSINIGYRYMIPTVKYYELSYAVNLAIYKSLLESNIEIPFPQREVRMIGK